MSIDSFNEFRRYLAPSHFGVFFVRRIAAVDTRELLGSIDASNNGASWLSGTAASFH